MPEQENRKRVIESANFNCVFGDNNEPLLAHFKDVLYPALTASNVIKYSNGYFNVENIKITEHSTLGYILTGVFVKQTELEILSQRDQDTGKLVFTDQKYQTAPYSIFAILLKNHRMLFYKNQKGSPRLSTFRKIVEDLVIKFLKEANHNIPYDDRLPSAHITILRLPSHKSLKEIFNNIKKIDSIEYKILPLNGDNDFRGPFQAILKQVMDLDASSCKMKFNGPDNKNKVIEQIEGTRDLARSTVHAYTNAGDSITLTEKEFAEKKVVELPKDADREEVIEALYNVADNYPALTETSNSNAELYRQKTDDIKSLMG